MAFAQINAIKGFSKRNNSIPLNELWDIYNSHPDRATPRTKNEQMAYQADLKEFLSFIACKLSKVKRFNHIYNLSDITTQVANKYAEYLKSEPLAVDTHNRKINRLRRIFACFTEHYEDEINPFSSKSLLRREQEEQGTTIRRQAFTKEQILQICETLSNPQFKVINKQELRVIYYLGIFTGQRLKDCTLLQWQNINFNKRLIQLKQYKTGKSVTIPIATELWEVLQEALEWKENQYVCPKTAERYNKVDRNNKNVGCNLVNKDVLRPIRWIGLEPSIEVEGRKKKMTVYGFHSLRHSFASQCAEAGVPQAVLSSILGADSEITNQYYTHIGDESQRKAIEVISNHTVNETTLRSKFNKILALLESAPKPTQEVFDRIKDILLD